MLGNFDCTGYGIEAQGELGFTYWTYATSDELREVLTADYFGSMCRSMRVGDMILVGTRSSHRSAPGAAATARPGACCSW